MPSLQQQYAAKSICFVGIARFVGVAFMDSAPVEGPKRREHSTIGERSTVAEADMPNHSERWGEYGESANFSLLGHGAVVCFEKFRGVSNRLNFAIKETVGCGLAFCLEVQLPNNTAEVGRDGS